MGDKLTVKQQAFIDHYVICLSGVTAAGLAGYKGNLSTLASVAYENLSKPQIKKVISERFKARTMDAEGVLRRLAAQAEFNPQAYVDNDGQVSISKLKEAGECYMIRSVTQTKSGPRVTFYDSQKALDLIAKHLGLFVEHLDLTSQGKPILDSEAVDKLTSMIETLGDGSSE